MVLFSYLKKSPLIYTPAQLFVNQGMGGGGSGKQRGSIGVAFIARDLFLLVVKSPLLKYERSLNWKKKIRGLKWLPFNQP